MRVKAYYYILFGGPGIHLANVINKHDYNFNESINLLLYWVTSYAGRNGTV